MDLITEKFVGPRKVESIQILEFLSFRDKEVYKVTYSGGDTEIMTKLTFDLVATDEPSDYTSVRDKQFEEFKKEFFPLLGNYLASFMETDEAKSKANRQTFLETSLILVGEYSIKQRDIDVLFDRIAAVITKESFNVIGNSIIENFNRVTNYLWTKDDRKFIPGTNPTDAVTFLETKGFLEKINEEQNK